MCSYKSWFLDDNGYVVQCNTCKHYQISFGTTNLTLNEHNFKVFCNSVFKAKEGQSVDNNFSLKCVLLPTPCSNVNCILTFDELTNLNFMLEEADTEIKSQELLQLFTQTAEK